MLPLYGCQSANNGNSVDMVNANEGSRFGYLFKCLEI